MFKTSCFCSLMLSLKGKTATDRDGDCEHKMQYVYKMKNRHTIANYLT